MKIQIKNQRLNALAGLILSLPAAWLIFSSLLKYGLGWSYLFDASQPLLERWGIKESIGLNINLIIVFGPVLALILNVLSVLHISFETTKERYDCRLSISRSWKNLAVVILSATLLLTLFIYLLG